MEKNFYIYTMDCTCVSTWINFTHTVLRKKKTVAGNMQYEVMHANVKHLPKNIVIIQRFLPTP